MGDDVENRSSISKASILSGEVVLPCDAVQPTVDFFVSRLGFRLDRISPADDPTTASLSGHGLRLLLQRGSHEPPGKLRLRCDHPHELEESLLAPNGTCIELRSGDGGEFSATPPALDFVGAGDELMVQSGGEQGWLSGRAGMQYRDLVPSRLGGHLIASQIRILAGGPVPDQVHYHAIRFQLIYCVQGWVRVVYEGQGQPFVLEPGDAVLQPPGMRHRVLESSAGLEVVEISCPAEHDTYIDHDMQLPTSGPMERDREYGGQRFVHHLASAATWTSRPDASADSPVQVRDLGIHKATAGLASVMVLRARQGLTAKPTTPLRLGHQDDLLFLCVLAGNVTVATPGASGHSIEAGGSVVVPPQLDAGLVDYSAGAQWLEVRMGSPAKGSTRDPHPG